MKSRLFRPFLAATLWMLFGVTAFGQQESIYSQYMFNRVVINPAYAGVKGYVSLTGLYRHQWSSFGKDNPDIDRHVAPKTFAFSGHGAAFTKHPTISHGFGGFMTGDFVGNTQTFTGGASYAFRIELEEQMFLSFGLQAGFIQWAIKGQDVRTYQPGDPVFPTNRETVTRPDFGAGVFFNTRRFYAGISVAHLVGFKMPVQFDASDAKLSRHYFANVGYDIRIKKDFILTPSVFMRAAEASDVPFQMDLNLNLMMLQRFWIGAGFRWDTDPAANDIILMAGFYPHEQLRIGYSFDWQLTKIQNYSSGTHEIMISFDFGNPNKARIITPRYF